MFRFKPEQEPGELGFRLAWAGGSYSHAAKDRAAVLVRVSSDSSGVDPLAQGGLDEALGFAVGPGMVGLGRSVVDAMQKTDPVKRTASVVWAHL